MVGLKHDQYKSVANEIAASAYNALTSEGKKCEATLFYKVCRQKRDSTCSCKSQDSNKACEHTGVHKIVGQNADVSETSFHIISKQSQE